ncbi:hypothetical protein [Acinetobacter sp. CFCC 10889]|uniref:hypothetical protein n=1 Tax=Acinetobacter sp. CFCC 10889 TaxID=1775557 RepID=UPI000DCFAF48|nr:hypothetical protein [Acinetobacter sp. CFCC 10889]
MLILAYFFVFLVGLVTCFKEAKKAWLCQKLTQNTSHQKRGFILKALCSASIGCLGIGGLVQATVGVF